MEKRKTCSGCKRPKLLKEFSYRKDSKDGKRGTCKVCYTQYKGGYYLRHRKRILQNYKVCQHGVTPEKLEMMLIDQGGKCLICKRVLDKPCVDHDHKCCPSDKSCGKCVRGLLCARCNAGIGLLGDCADTLSSAAEYVRSYHQKEDNE